MERVWDKVLLVCDVLSGVLLLGMMFFTSPSGVGPLGILTFLLASYVLFSGLAVVGCRLFFRLATYFNKAYAKNVKKKSYHYGAAIAIAPVALMACSSMGGIKIVEVVLIVAVECILCFFIAHDII